MFFWKSFVKRIKKRQIKMNKIFADSMDKVIIGVGERMRRILEVNFALIVFLFVSPLMAQDVEKGASLYKKCIVCHGKNGEGKRSQKAPRIGGQFDWYVYQQLKDIKSMVRKNDAMMPYVKNLSDQDFKDLSAYISSLK